MASQPLDYRHGRPAPDSGFELWWWFFMRVSGVLLLFLAIGHLLIMHIFNSIETIDYWFVVERWRTPFWRIYDGLMLILALLHGWNGMRWIIDDYARPGGWRVLWLSLLYTFGFIFLLMGLTTVFTFQPQ